MWENYESELPIRIYEANNDSDAILEIHDHDQHKE